MNSRTNQAGNNEKKTVSFATFFVVDLHKCTVTLAAVYPHGIVISILPISTQCIVKFQTCYLPLPNPSLLVVLAACLDVWFILRYRSSVYRIDIADATELSNRRGKRRKTDRNDALDIALRLARGECPLGFIADEPLMQLRKLGRHWRQLSLSLSRTKHYMRSILLAANIRGPKLDGASAQRWFLAHGGLLKDVQRQAFTNFTDIIILIERQRESLKREIIMANRSDDFSAQTTLLQSIPGIAEIWSCIIAAEVGPFDRFPNADALEFWAGMTADLKESAGRTQSGKITKAGSVTLRWALCKAAVTLCKSDARQEAIRQRLIKKAGNAKANVAMGRRLLRTIYAMFRDWSFYQAGQRTNHLAAANKARSKKRKTKKEAA